MNGLNETEELELIDAYEKLESENKRLKEVLIEYIMNNNGGCSKKEAIKSLEKILKEAE